MRKSIITFLCSAMIMLSTFTAFATESVSVENAELGDGTKQITQVYCFGLDEEQNGIPESFEMDGFCYSEKSSVLSDTTMTDFQDVAIEKNISATIKLTSVDFAETIDYEEDGYVGTLTRDDNTFSCVSTGVRNVNKTVTETKSYTGLARNDMGAIDKVYNGLPLVSVDWYDQNTGQSVRGYTEGTPGPYSAVAYYKDVRSSRVTTGYAANVTYRGTIEKEIVTGAEVSVTYIGNLIPKDNIPALSWWMWVLAGIAGCGVLGFLIWLIFARRKGATRR